MSELITLRDYQERSMTELLEWFDKNQSGNPLMVLPTGAGKSILIAAIVQYAMQFPGQRILMITHVRELIEQNHEKLVNVMPDCESGIYSAGVGRRDTKAQVLFCGIQSIYNKAAKIGRADVIIIDEAHLLPKKDTGMYRRFLHDMTNEWGRPVIIGLTATPFRLDSGSLIEGEDRIFDAIATEVSITELIDKGYLSPITSKPTGYVPDLSKVRKRMGEFVERDISEIYADGLAEQALDNMLKAAHARISILIFCTNVQNAITANIYLEENGVNSAVVTGQTPKSERDEILRKFKAGEIRALCNCEVLTTGFDAPNIDCIVLMRPTLSTALYIQMIGRGLRIHSSKQDCLVLDYAGNIERHGCVDDPNIYKPKKKNDKKAEAPTKTCPECNEYCHASVRECLNCGFVFPEPELKLDSHHSDAPLLKKQIELKPAAVGSITYSRHSKAGKPPSLKATYYQPGIIPFEIASEWIAFESENEFAMRMAANWWQRRASTPVPQTVAEALARQLELLPAKAITVDRSDKYPRITSHQFDVTQPMTMKELGESA